MHTVPALALSAAYWLHMLATITWIGGLAGLSLILLPAARRALDETAYADLLGHIQRRLDPLAWLSLIVLVATGMFQMSASPHYEGFLAIRNQWAAAILIKHLLVGVMIAVSAYLTWGVLPALRRNALRRAAGVTAPGDPALQQREVLLLRVNLLLGVFVLALTAIARAA